MKIDIVAKKDDYSLFEATNKANPNEEDKKRLQIYLKENPVIWESITDLAGKVQNSVISSLAKESYLAQESYRQKLAAMRDNLGWQTASELEKILIEQVCLNWLRLNFIEIVHREKTLESHTIEWGNYWDKTLSSAQRRHLRACESLAKVRKLLAEAELKEQQARNKRSKSTLIAQQVLKNATK
jgi:hypothetical protein